MSWFSNAKHDSTDRPAPSKVCAHGSLAPRWDRAEDMGKLALASSFECVTCHQHLTAAEATAIEASKAGAA